MVTADSTVTTDSTVTADSILTTDSNVTADKYEGSKWQNIWDIGKCSTVSAAKYNGTKWENDSKLHTINKDSENYIIL